MKIKNILSKKNIFSITGISVCAVFIAVSSFVPHKSNTKATTNNGILKNEQVSVSIADIEALQAQAYSTESEESLASSFETAFALYIDNKMIATSETKDEILSVLENIKVDSLKQYAGKKAFAKFIQNVEIKEGVYDSEPISSDEISKILSTPVEEEFLYTIQDGDAPYSICYKYGLSLDEFIELNGDNFDDYMYGGKQVKVKEEKLPLTVEVTVQDKYTKTISFETETSYDENDYSDHKVITQKGKNGKTQYIDEVSYINGKEVSRKNLSKTVICKPVTEKVTVGTIEHHYGYAYGSFIWPVPGYTMITSEFGPRWGTNHNGIDISGSGVYGADITASDGGTVTLAQYDNSGYGMHIIIDHGNGFETLYAHCSELYVQPGDQVYAGQVIAAVGSTGDSTGPHLHFEIILNGKKVDPQIYI